MADIRKAPQRRLLRVCERHRLERQLLACAYESLRPVLRSAVSRPTADGSAPADVAIPSQTLSARSA
jgi:hypothetical protein